MKYLLSVLAFSLLFLSLKAQDKIPGFGKIEKTELEMKECDFDPGSEALVLLDVGSIKFFYSGNDGWQSESLFRVRIKILKASALDRAQIKLRYYSKNRTEEISNLSGISYNLDANGKVTETKMEKSAVFDKVIDKEHSEISFALPEVKIGTVFEYKYKLFRKSFGYIPTWQFQQRIPVRYSAYNIVIPEYFVFTVQATQRQKMERVDGKYEGDGIWYMMHNIPGLKEEPHSSGLKNYLQRVEFQLSKIQTPSYYEEFRNTWPKLITALLENEDFGPAIKKNIRGTSDLDKQLVGLTSVKKKIKTIYNYVQTNMQWDESYGIYSEKGIKDAWDKKSGSITDINFILIRLLRDAGISADPLLVSTKDNGTINGVFPFLNQFNAVMAFVQEEDEWYAMNAADKYNPFNLVPYDVLYTDALVVDKKNGGLIRLSSNQKFLSNIFFTSSIEADGKLSGQATIKSSGYARNISLSSYKKTRLKEMFEENNGITIKTDSMAVNNEKDELQPLEQNVNFSGNIQSSGEYFFLPYNLFTQIGKNPFISEDRVMDIDFDFPKSYVVTGSYVLADDYIVNALPKNTKMIMPDTSIVMTRVMQNDGNVISFLFTLDIKAPGYTAESYPYVKEFFRMMYSKLDERIVLKKK